MQANNLQFLQYISHIGNCCCRFVVCILPPKGSHQLLFFGHPEGDLRQLFAHSEFAEVAAAALLGEARGSVF